MTNLKRASPTPGTQFSSAILADVGEHSAKPELFLEMIEQLFPGIRR
jgi:hypothetical protein